MVDTEPVVRRLVVRVYPVTTTWSNNEASFSSTIAFVKALVTLIVLDFIPKYDTVMVFPLSTHNEILPSISAITPTGLPFTFTVAPPKGLPSVSVMVVTTCTIASLFCGF